MMPSGFTQVLGHYLDSICHPLSPVHAHRRPVRPEISLLCRVDPYSQVDDVAAGRVGIGASVSAGAVAVAAAGGCSQPRKLGPLTVTIC